MSDRLLRVNAYTTLDFVDARARGHDFEADAPGVVNVTAPREDPDRVDLQVELDDTGIDALPAHADEVALSPAQARTLAEALESAAVRVEAAQGDADGE
ncbi:DUF6360 family protein [Halorubrum halodurans]|uniref:Uncharacterized protein n=1 Tax=Halorubrum halodurans TaxID=1383851 RepID=A0A256IMQ7_9EURY|nr:DUF6360 family protein [Halorubrum halodurans]OYR57801.1 hypothetical protein DJ70_04860 [Halorubrum halodurans]